MITTPTVFILGAGASCPYGLPSGDALLQHLIEGGDFPRSEQDRMFNASHEPPTGFRHALAGSKAESIDAFLESRKEDMLDVGKLCLAAALTAREDPSLCHPRGEDWIRELLHSMRRGTSDMAQNKVSFITYNYDRLLEHSLTEALAHTRGCTSEAAWKEISKLNIIHPHGLLGPYLPFPDGWSRSDPRSRLPQLIRKDGRMYYPSGDLRLPVELASKHINLYWEANPNQQDTRKRMSETLQSAKRIIFLGFGFLDANMEHLKPMLPHSDDCQYHGTRMGMSVNRKARAIEAVPGLRFSTAFIETDCIGLLNNYVDVESPFLPPHSRF